MHAHDFAVGPLRRRRSERRGRRGRGGDAQSDGALGDGTTTDAAPASAYARAVLADKPLLYYRLGEASNGGVAHDQASGRNAVFNGNIATGLPGAIARDPDTA